MMLMKLQAWARDRAERTPPPGMMLRPDTLSKEVFRLLMVVDGVEFVWKAEVDQINAAGQAELVLRGDDHFPLPLGMAMVLTEEIISENPRVPADGDAATLYSALAGSKHLAEPNLDPRLPPMLPAIQHWYGMLGWIKEYRTDFYTQVQKLAARLGGR